MFAAIWDKLDVVKYLVQDAKANVEAVNEVHMLHTNLVHYIRNNTHADVFIYACISVCFCLLYVLYVLCMCVCVCVLYVCIPPRSLSLLVVVVVVVIVLLLFLLPIVCRFVICCC